MVRRASALLAAFATAISTAAAVNVLATMTIPGNRGTAALVVLGLLLGIGVAVVGYSLRSVTASTSYW
jgi:hypothetical protein